MYQVVCTVLGPLSTLLSGTNYSEYLYLRADLPVVAAGDVPRAAGWGLPPVDNEGGIPDLQPPVRHDGLIHRGHGPRGVGPASGGTGRLPEVSPG